MDKQQVIDEITKIFDKHEVWTISISCRPEIIEEIANLFATEMSFDEAEAAGYDGTGRGIDIMNLPIFP